MANVFVNLPMPAFNGAGAAVDVSTMGGLKTIVVAGTFDEATIAVEISEEAAGPTQAWAPIAMFQSGDTRRLVRCAARYMRVNVSGRKTSLPFSANADVGANDAGALFATIAMPALNGPGAAVDVSALGGFSTFVVGGTFPGATIGIEGSEDGTDYAPICAFAGQGGQQSALVTANWVRANVAGRKVSLPFTATAAVGAINDASGGGGSGSPTNWQAFVYTATGVEGANFTVTIPVAQPDAAYEVLWRLGTVVRQFTLVVDDASKLVGSFDVELTTAPQLGDEIHFNVYNA